MIRAIFSDIDGTLLNSQHRISPRTAAVIRRVHADPGLDFVMVSARPPMAISPFTNELGLRSPFVCFNGALIVTAGLQVVHGITLGETDFIGVETALADWPGLSINYYYQLEWYSNDPLGYWSAQEGEITGLRAAPRPDGLKDAHKILVMADAEQILALENALAGQFAYLSIKRSKDTYLEIVHQSATKSGAIRFMEAYLGVKQNEVIAFGDNFNDLDMLEYAEIGVAMGNSPDGVKQAASEVTLSNDDDGLAVVLERLFPAR